MAFSFRPALAAGLALGCGQAVAGSPSYQSIELGLTGAAYNSASGGFSHALDFNASGQAVGYSSRYSAAGADLGTDAWYFDGTTTRQIGFSGAGYSYDVAGGTYDQSTAIQINSSGQSIGYTRRVGTSGQPLGTDAWIYDGTKLQTVGLKGGALGVVYTDSYAIGISDNGVVFGQVNRQDFTTHNDLGSDLWVYEGGVTRQVGLNVGLGPQPMYQYEEFRQVDPSGQAIGVTQRYDDTGASLGQNAWIYSQGDVWKVGFTTSGYSAPRPGNNAFQYSDIVQLNASGRATGYSNRYSSAGTYLGSEAWLTTRQSTVDIGLYGPGYAYTTGSGDTFESGRASQINHNWGVLGQADRYNSAGIHLGTDAWVYNGNNTRRVGLIDSAHSFAASFAGGDAYREAYADHINDPGQVTGVSYRYNTAGSMLGQDAWFDDGTSSQMIGLTGAAYSHPSSEPGGGTYQANWPLRMNNAGDVIGYANRYDSAGNNLGFSGWFFDPATAQTTPLEFAFRPGDNFSYTRPVALTSDGSVIGEYEQFPNGVPTNHLFRWSLSGGMTDLGTLVTAGLSDADALNISQLEDFTVPATVATTPPTPLLINSQAGHAMMLVATQAPEPMSLVPLVGALLWLRRQRTRS